MQLQNNDENPINRATTKTLNTKARRVKQPGQRLSMRPVIRSPHVEP
jgi:hypothetical protein